MGVSRRMNLLDIRVKTPTELAAGGWKKISKQVKCTFISALLAGLAAHLYQYTNKIYNYDDLFTNPGGYGTGAESGRWFLQFMGEWMNKTLGNYSLPLMNGLLTLFLLALSAAMITGLFKVQDMLLSAFLGMLFTTFPTVVCMNFFMYTVAYYAVAVFFSVLAAWLIIKFPKSILRQAAAVLLLACAVGTYQAYLANTVCLLVLSVVLLSAFSGKETDTKSLVLTSVRYVVLLVLGLLCYFALNRFSLAYWNVALGDYQGINNMGKIELSRLPEMIKNCYFSFFWFGKNDIFQENPTRLVKNCILILYAVSAFFTVCVFIKQKTGAGKKVLLLLSLAAYPIAVFLLYIMVPDGWIYTLMTFSVVFIYVFIFVWLDRCQIHLKDIKTKLWNQLMQWGVTAAALVIAVVYIWYANGNYMAMQFTQYHDLSYFQTMVTQIKSQEGYRNGLPLAVIGRYIDDNANRSGSLIGAEFDLPGKNETNVNTYSRWQILIKYLGYNPQFLWANETAEFEKLLEVQEMPCYPEDGSIKIVDDVIVLKLSNEEPE